MSPGSKPPAQRGATSLWHHARRLVRAHPDLHLLSAASLNELVEREAPPTLWALWTTRQRARAAAWLSILSRQRAEGRGVQTTPAPAVADDLRKQFCEGVYEAVGLLPSEAAVDELINGVADAQEFKECLRGVGAALSQLQALVGSPVGGVDG